MADNKQPNKDTPINGVNRDVWNEVMKKAPAPKAEPEAEEFLKTKEKEMAKEKETTTPPEQTQVEQTTEAPETKTEGAVKPEGETPKSKKDMFFENMRAKYKGENGEELDEEGIYGKAMEGYDADHDKLKGILKDNETVIEKLKENPEIAVFIGDVVSGKIPPEAITYLMDNYEGVEDIEGYDEYKKNFQSRKEWKAKLDAEAEEILNNSKESEKAFEEYAQKEGMTVDDVKEAIGKANEAIILPLQKGKFTVDTLDKIMKVLDLEEILKATENKGYLRGREESLAARKAKTQGDGMPSAGSSAPIKPRSSNVENPYLPKDVWKTGGLG